MTPDTIVSLLSFNLDKNNTSLYRNLTDAEANIQHAGRGLVNQPNVWEPVANRLLRKGGILHCL